MISWKNFDALPAYARLQALAGRFNLAEAMAGENGARRVKGCSVPMAGGLSYNYAAKQVEEEVRIV